MPKEGISLYFTVKDGASPTLTTLGDKTRALDKDTEELARAYSTLQKANEPLIRRQAELQAQLKNVNDQIRANQTLLTIP